MEKQYTADTISTYSNLQHIRQRPTAYLVNREMEGVVHVASEVVANSVDELSLSPTGGVVHILLFRDRRRNRYQLVFRDYMRGIPATRLTDATTVLGTSGKIDENTAYLNSGGLFGMGLKTSAALSTRFRAISKNYLEKVVSSIYLENAEQKDRHDETFEAPSGFTVVYEPDTSPAFFTCGTDFMETGYLDLIALLKQLNVFNPLANFQVYLYERSLPEEFWTSSTKDALAILDEFIHVKQKSVEYASDQVPDKAAYLFEIWRTNSAVIFQETLHKDPVNKKDKLGFDIKLYFTKKSATGNPQFFVTVNNIALLDKTGNSATQAFLQVLRRCLSDKMQDEKLARFVANEYKFPTMLLALGIRYVNAEFSGATKTSFTDSAFAKQFAMEAATQFSFMDRFWERLLELLMPDIEARYAQFYDTPRKKNDDKQIFTKLNFPRNYFECRMSDPSRCELYIVEGTSAGNITQTRDPDYQAVYLTRGKPFNAATMLDAMNDNRASLKKDPLYQDLCQIININEHTTDPSSLRFCKVIIATDADPDGAHIRCLHLLNFYIINPLMIDSGILWLANPPLYSMKITKNKHLFLRDRTALMDARVEFLYKPTLDVKIDSKAGVIELDGKAYRDMCYMVNHVGEKFEQVAKQLNIPLSILERLVWQSENLYPVLKLDKLPEGFASADPTGTVKVQIDQSQRSLVVSIGREDYVVGLDSVGETIVHHLLPLVKRFRYRDYMYLVRSRHGGDMANYVPMSLTMLYQCMQQLDGLFEIYRYKGLGQMRSQDCYNTLMNPATRSLTHVTDIGDIQANYDLLGTNTTKRKELLSDSQVLTASFVRNNPVPYN